VHAKPSVLLVSDIDRWDSQALMLQQMKCRL